MEDAKFCALRPNELITIKLALENYQPKDCPPANVINLIGYIDKYIVKETEAN